MRKSATFQIAGKLQYTPIDNGFKQVEIAYLAVISNLDKLVHPLLLAIYANHVAGKASPGLAKQCLSLCITSDR